MCWFNVIRKRVKLRFHIRGKRRQHADAVFDLFDSIYLFTHAFALSFPERRRVKNMANQSKMQLSLLDMEQHELLLIVVAHKRMQLKTDNKRRKHDVSVISLPHNFSTASTAAILPLVL